MKLQGPRDASKYIKIKSVAWVFVLVITKGSCPVPQLFWPTVVSNHYPSALCFLASRESLVPTTCLEPKVGAAFLSTSVPIISWSPTLHLDLKQAAETHQFSPAVWKAFVSGTLFFFLFVFLKHCRSQISPRALMHGVTSAPSSPAVACKKQWEGRRRREKRENTEGVERTEQKATHHSDFSLELWHKEHSLPWQCKVEQQKEWCGTWYKNQTDNNKALGVAFLYFLYLQSTNCFQVLARSQAGEWIW